MHHSATRQVFRAAAIAILAAGLVGIAQTPPQTPPDSDPQRPTFRTEANFVRVDVYPTSAGKPIVDLRREDFELLEDGRPQAIDTFEFIRVSPAGPQPQRAHPNTIEAMRQAAADPRSRILVVLLDVPHVTEDGAQRIGQALVRFIERVLGPDDLIGIMTPGMSPADVVLARTTQVVAAGLRDGSWGRRFTPYEDERESLYKMCYRVLQQELEQGKTVSDLAKVLTLRRREVMTLEAMRDLVMYLRGIREERKAILAVTEGWVLFRPDAQITRLREECTCPRGGSRRERRDLQDCSGCKPFPPGRPWKEAVPGAEPLRVGPDGRLTLGGLDTESGIVTNDCKADRMRLAGIDNAQFLRDLANDANRANATFYTIDPRGLAVFDTPIYRDMDEIGMPPDVAEDGLGMSRRHDAMADLAVGTDGIALLNTNDLDAALRRIADDLSSYYLLGYYSTNAKLDGKFRTIRVRVKRPGVEVRARRGYRAPSEAEVVAARSGAVARSGGERATPPPVSAVASALATLARLRPEARFRMHAIPRPNVEGGPVSAVLVAGELPPGLQGWAQGGTASLECPDRACQERARSR